MAEIPDWEHTLNIAVISSILGRANAEHTDGVKKIEAVLATMSSETVAILAHGLSEVTLKAFSPESKDLFQ